MANNKNANKGVSGIGMKKDDDKKVIVLVKFLKSYTPYIKGEVAGFDKKFAGKLIEHEIAEKFNKGDKDDDSDESDD